MHRVSLAGVKAQRVLQTGGGKPSREFSLLSPHLLSSYQSSLSDCKSLRRIHQPVHHGIFQVKDAFMLVWVTLGQGWRGVIMNRYLLSPGAQPCAVSAFSHGPGDAGGDLGEARDPWSHCVSQPGGTRPVTWHSHCMMERRAQTPMGLLPVSVLGPV